MWLSVTESPPWDVYTPRQRRAFLLVLFLVGTSNNLDKNIISVLLEQIKAEFRASDTMLGLLSGISFALFYATFGIPAARWADRGDRKLVITVSLAIWSAMTVLCGFAGTFWQLVMARFGVGAGEAGAMPPAQSLLAHYYPPAERAKAIGILMMSSAAGYAVGLVLGGFIAQYYGWRAAFVVVGLAGMALAPLTHFVLKEPRRIPQFALRPESYESIFTTIGILLQKAAYRNIVGAIIVFFLMGYGVLVFVVSLMIRLYGLSIAQAGTIFGAISAIAAIVGNHVGGKFADKLVQRDIKLLPRMAGWTMISAVPIYELALAAPRIRIMVPLLLLSMAILNAVLPPLFAALHMVCGSKRRAMSVAVAYLFANLVGVGLGPVMTGYISDRLRVHWGAGEGLRYSLMMMMCVLVPAGRLMLRAARNFASDAEA
jgi:MFS family permease